MIQIIRTAIWCFAIVAFGGVALFYLNTAPKANGAIQDIEVVATCTFYVILVYVVARAIDSLLPPSPPPAPPPSSPAIEGQGEFTSPESKRRSDLVAGILAVALFVLIAAAAIATASLGP